MDQRDDREAEANNVPEPDLTQALQIVAEQMRALAQENPRVRALVRGLGHMLLAIAAQPTAESALEYEEPPAPEINTDLDGTHSNTALTVHPNGSAATELPFSVRSVPAVRWDDALDHVTDDDLALIAARCRLKAEAARWSAARANVTHTGRPAEASEAHDYDLIERARQVFDCYLWMYRRDVPTDDEAVLYQRLAGCFDVAADVVELLCEALTADEGPPLGEQTIQLAAEAQSSLRAAVLVFNRGSDRDQMRLFNWLRQRSAAMGAFIRRFMRVDDAADPAAWLELQARVAQTSAALRQARAQRRRERNQLGKARYHLKLIAEHPGEERLYDWQKVIDTISAAVESGTPASSRDIREVLLPVLDAMPGALAVPRSMERVLSEIDAYLASEPSNVPVASGANTSAAMLQAREMLQGRAVVLIGGVRRPDAAEQLREALALTELIWIETREHQTHTVFEPYVARPDVALVLLAIRWSSHGFSEVQTFCDRYGKPLVRLPTGYNPNQVAYQIVSQVSQQLLRGEVLALPDQPE